jgi:phage terminase Nu1 subunit (DNA packaging protein)
LANLHASPKPLPVRDRLIIAQAKRAELVNRKEAGELVEAAAVEATWIDLIVTVRTRLLAIPARVAARHPGHPEIIETLTRELHATMHKIADDEL